MATDHQRGKRSSGRNWLPWPVWPDRASAREVKLTVASAVVWMHVICIAMLLCAALIREGESWQTCVWGEAQGVAEAVVSMLFAFAAPSILVWKWVGMGRVWGSASDHELYEQQQRSIPSSTVCFC